MYQYVIRKLPCVNIANKHVIVCRSHEFKVSWPSDHFVSGFEVLDRVDERYRLICMLRMWRPMRGSTIECILLFCIFYLSSFLDACPMYSCVDCSIRHQNFCISHDAHALVLLLLFNFIILPLPCHYNDEIGFPYTSD